MPPLAETASLTFDANGGSNAPAVVVDDPGATVSVAETSPQRSGFGFDGWNTDAGGTGTAYASGDDYTLPSNDGDVDTLYAQWDPVGYTHVTGSTALDGNGALQDGSVVKLDITVSPNERFILSNDYLMALMASFASSGSSEHVFIGVPSSTFDAASIGSSDFLSAFKVYRQNATNLMFEQHNNGSYGASLSRSATALTQDAVFELSNSGELIRLFEDDMNNTLTEDVASGTRHDVGDADTTPRSIYIAAVGKGLTLPATSEGAYKIAIPTPTPNMLTYAGNIDSLVADGTSDVGHIAVNSSGDVFSVTRAGEAWISKHSSSGVEQWRVATPISGAAYLAAASDGGLYVGGLDPVSGNGGVVKLDGDGNIEWSQFTAIAAGKVEINGIDVLEGAPDSGAVFVGKVTSGNGETLTYGTLTAAIPTGHAEYVAHVGADGTPIMIDATARGTAYNFRGYSSVDARPNGSGAWWIAVGSSMPSTTTLTPTCLRFTYDPTTTPPLVEDFECGNDDHAYDVALLSDGSVAAANWATGNEAQLKRFNASDGSTDWSAIVFDDANSPNPASSRGLDVDSSDGIYYAARTVGNTITIRDSSNSDSTITFTENDPNGLLIKFSATGIYQWSRTVGSGDWTKASTVAVSGSTVYLGTSAKALMQFDAYRKKYTWKPAIFKFNSSGVSHT